MDDDDDLETGPGPPVATATVTKPLQDNDRHDEVERLRTENRRLDGKLRGYQTLNHLFQEAKEECRKLQQKNKELTQKFIPTEPNVKLPENDSPETSTAHAQPTRSGEDIKSGEEMSGNNVKPDEATSSQFPLLAARISTNSSVPSSVMFGSGKKNFDSTEHTTTPNEQSERLVDIGEYPVSGRTPMQESLSGPHLFQPPISIAIPVSESSLPVVSPAADLTYPYPLEENVTFDSDVVDEEEFIKLRTKHNSIISSGYGPPSARMSAWSGYVGLDDDARLGQDRYYPKPTYPCEIPQRTSPFTKRISSSEHDASSDHLGGSPTSFHVAGDLTNMVDKIVKLEQSERGWKALAETLQADMHRLKSKFAVMAQDKDNSSGLLKAENQMLLKKIKKLEHERDALSPGDSVSSETRLVGNDWVRVEKQRGESSGADNVSTVEETEYSALVGKVRFMELKNKELTQANKEWEDYRRKSETEQHGKMLDLRSRLEASERNLMEFRIQDEKRQREIDKILLASKSRCHSVEEEKEEYAAQLEDSKARCANLEGRIRGLEQNVIDLNRELQTSRTHTEAGHQMNQLSGNQSRRTTTEPPQEFHHNVEELINEKEALKQQLTIFQEDFDRERADRAKAQSDKDELQRKLSELSKQTKHSHSQMRTAEETLRRTLDENERLQRQVREFKMKQARRAEVMAPPPAMQTAQLYYPPQHGVPQHHQGWTSVQGQRTTFQQARPTQNAPELLPGSWQCPACTLVNYPGRTVCEACGHVRQQRQVQTPVQHPPPGGEFGNPNAVGMPYYSSGSQHPQMMMYQQQDMNNPNIPISP